jgi:hypothetical protein
MLQNAQIRAIQGYPGREMPQLQQPAVAVNMKLYDTAGRLLTVVAEIRSPAEKHGWACEDLATSVAQILAVQGAACRQGKCQYDSKTGQFYVQVEATWHEPALVEEMVASLPFRVYLNGNRLEYAVGFTAEQTMELEKVGAIGEAQAAHLLARDTGWVITLEELFPKHAVGTADMEQPAQLQILRSDGAEMYLGCIWTKLQRKETMDGVKQVRTGWTETREVYIGG